MKKNNKERTSPGEKFEQLLSIMSQLRGKNGCPWDKEQTHHTLRQYLLEETFEVLETLDEENYEELSKELGDLLLQIVFHAQIAAENKHFLIDDVLREITDKLIRRHPNVFGNLIIETAEEQSVNWEKIKQAEGKKSVIDGVPKALSALLRAARIQQKATTVGFDWPDEEPVWLKIEEELAELKHACTENSRDNIEEEFGDLLFSLVNLSRFLHINAEDALRRTIEKFIYRFQKIEQEFETQNRSIHDASLEEMDTLWNKIKAQEKNTVK